MGQVYSENRKQHMRAKPGHYSLSVFEQSFSDVSISKQSTMQENSRLGYRGFMTASPTSTRAQTHWHRYQYI